jgi:hypothetical protein
LFFGQEVDDAEVEILRPMNTADARLVHECQFFSNFSGHRFIDQYGNYHNWGNWRIAEVRKRDGVLNVSFYSKSLGSPMVYGDTNMSVDPWYPIPREAEGRYSWMDARLDFMRLSERFLEITGRVSW